MQSQAALAFTFSVIALCMGCGAIASGGGDANANGDAGDAPSSAVGTRPPDGAPGVCCPASTGGCAKSGGYHADGKCPVGNDICDNMCEQRIVKDEHGCNKLTYKTPPVQTTYAGTQSCGAPVFNGGDTTPPPTLDCPHEDVDNDASCPPAYSRTFAGKPCPEVDLACAYPGQGDPYPNGCAATAMMWCRTPSRGDAGADADAGPATWTLAQ